MKKNLVKPIIGGILFGAAIFFAGPFLFFILLLKFIFTPFGMGRMMMHHRYYSPMGMHPNMRYAMADKIRSMSEEEYASFKEKMNSPYSCSNKFNNPKQS